MEQQNAAQGLIDWGNKLRSLPGRLLGAANKLPPSKKADTSWHDDMVKRANASFQKRDAASRPKILKKTDRKRNTGKKMTK